MFRCIEVDFACLQNQKDQHRTIDSLKNECTELKSQISVEIADEIEFRANKQESLNASLAIRYELREIYSLYLF